MNVDLAITVKDVGALVLAFVASSFWVAALLQAVIGDAGQTTMQRTASTATALASAIMIAQIAWIFCCTTCGS